MKMNSKKRTVVMLSTVIVGILMSGGIIALKSRPPYKFEMKGDEALVCELYYSAIRGNEAYLFFETRAFPERRMIQSGNFYFPFSTDMVKVVGNRVVATQTISACPCLFSRHLSWLVCHGSELYIVCEDGKVLARLEETPDGLSFQEMQHHPDWFADVRAANQDGTLEQRLSGVSTASGWSIMAHEDDRDPWPPLQMQDGDKSLAIRYTITREGPLGVRVAVLIHDGVEEVEFPVFVKNHRPI